MHRNPHNLTSRLPLHSPRQPRRKSTLPAKPILHIKTHPLTSLQEYLHRPTAHATWWSSPHSHILGGYDLYRPGHGTWLGISIQGRIAVLTNYREAHQSIVPGALSRGQLPNSWLTAGKDESTDDVARRMIEQGGVKGIGGFSLCYGYVQDVVKGEGLAIVSNRTPDVEGVIRVLQSGGETRALSNTAYSDRSWPKVLDGEALTEKAIKESVAAGETREQLVDRLLGVLSTDTMPPKKEDENWVEYFNQLRKSIFVPLLKKSREERRRLGESEKGTPTSGDYGTQKSIVVLVDRKGKVCYLERTFYDEDVKPIEQGKGDCVFEFQIEGWSSDESSSSKNGVSETVNS